MRWSPIMSHNWWCENTLQGFGHDMSCSLREISSTLAVESVEVGNRGQGRLPVSQNVFDNCGTSITLQK